MLPKTFIKGYDQRRLRLVIAALFLALSIPTGVVIWQAYNQLKWESYYQYRAQAEELTRRIDGSLMGLISTADTRKFADFGFLVIEGDLNANFMQRSPLSTYPVAADVPGVVGYFQVDTDGAFSTPLLPPDGTDVAQFGISQEEFTNREMLAREIRDILADNSLVRTRPSTNFEREIASLPESPIAGAEEEKERTDTFEADVVAAAEAPMLEAALTSAATESVAAYADTPAESEPPVDLQAQRMEFQKLRTQYPDDHPDVVRMANELQRQALTQSVERGYNQEVFDELNAPARQRQVGAASVAGIIGGTAGGESAAAEQRLNTIGKVSDLKLDADLEEKNEEIAQDRAPAAQKDMAGRLDSVQRMKRREQSALPESPKPGARRAAPGTADLRISTFESEIDPFEFSLLDSGHVVLFRKVWRDGERYIQGLLIDQGRFVYETIETAFRATTLSGMSDLVVGYQDDVIGITYGGNKTGYPMSIEALQGSLLYRNRLSAPLNSLELIFSVNVLPLGPGAAVLTWTTIIIAIVFVSGFLALYRLGLGQIRLARQQQNFVSAVSHELKTPLTSIRMYGEMLKEGWADEEKQKQYYEYIHDESERLTRLISNVLQLAKITRNEPQFDLKPITVGELMDQVRSKIANQVERAGFTLDLQQDENADSANVDADDDCFAQIIINLVDNAIKFSKNAETKRIEIRSALTKDGMVTFSIRDHGPGIPKDQMKKIFRLFYRTESELTRETVGTGIGLAIVHQLTAAMNGKVDVANRNPGVEFRVAFASA